MSDQRQPTGTVLEALVASLEGASVYNRSAMVVPAAILWPDEHREWEALLPLLREVNPHLLTLGTWNATARTGPAIWLKCMIGRTLDAEAWPEDGSTSLSTGPKPVDAEGTVSLLVPDDEHVGMAAFLVVVNAAGTVLAKSTTSVGGDD